MKRPTPANPPSQLEWFKSTFSSNANQCVEVRFHVQVVEVRDSKNHQHQNEPISGTIVRCSVADWRVFLAGVCAGDFELAHSAAA